MTTWMTFNEVREIHGEGTVSGVSVFDGRTAGDIGKDEGKLDMLATGLREAAVAVNDAVRSVNPGARVNPGHSTSMAVFKDRRAARTT